MNSITYVKEKGNIDTIKNDKILKLPWEPNLGPTVESQNCFLIVFWVFTSKAALAMPYILAKLKRKSSLEPWNINRTVSTEYGQDQAN